MQGLELSADYRIDGIAAGRLSMPLALQYTWTTEAEFHNAFASDFEPWGDVEVGDELPYIPEHQLRLAAGSRATGRLNLAASYVGRMRTVAGQGPFEATRTIGFARRVGSRRPLPVYRAAGRLFQGRQPV